MIVVLVVLLLSVGASAAAADNAAPSKVAHNTSGSLRVGHVAADGASVLVSLSCHGHARSWCEARLTMRTVERRRRGRIVGLAAPSPGRKTVTVGAMRVVLSAGSRRQVRLAPNALGRRLLARFHRLPVKLTIKPLGMTRIEHSSIGRFKASRSAVAGR